MKCLAIYDWEADFGMDSVYHALKEYLSQIPFDVKGLKVVFHGWPRAKAISASELSSVLGQIDQIKSIEGKLGFFSAGGHAVGLFLISSMPKMLFVGLPNDLEKIADFEALIISLAERTELGYGYTFENEDGNESVLYASGVTLVKAGESAYPKSSEADGRWFNELVLGKDGRKRYKDDGGMRGAYCLNVLNAHHLERKIGDESFSSLIRKTGWGHIKKIGANNWLWRISGENRTEAENYLRSSSVFI